VSRSIIAEALLKKMLAERGRDDVVVSSGGIAPYARDSSLVSMDARLVLRDDAIYISPEATACDLKRHRDRLLEADLIVTMTAEQKRMLAEFPEASGKDVMTLHEAAGECADVEDPAGRDEAFYSACRDQIRRCLEKAMDRLAPPPGR
jgi:protein-tyrosine-phosphatase